MNAKEAKNHLRLEDHIRRCTLCHDSRSYLQALEGEEVKELVTALEFLHEAFEKVEDGELQGKYILNSHAFMVRDALSKFKEAVKP